MKQIKGLTYYVYENVKCGSSIQYLLEQKTMSILFSNCYPTVQCRSAQCVWVLLNVTKIAIWLKVPNNEKLLCLQPLYNVWWYAVAGASDAADVANSTSPHLDAGAALVQWHKLAGDVDADQKLLRHGEQQAQSVAAVAAAVGARCQATVGAGGAWHWDRGGVCRILPKAHSHRPAKATSALAGGPRWLAQQIAR